MIEIRELVEEVFRDRMLRPPTVHGRPPTELQELLREAIVAPDRGCQNTAIPEYRGGGVAEACYTLVRGCRTFLAFR